MKRRMALQHMGLTVGYMAITPMIVNIMQSCSNPDTDSPKTIFFTPSEFIFITTLTDVILPKTDTPSGTEVQVHYFIDRYVNAMYDDSKKNRMKKNLKGLKLQVKSTLGKVDISKLDSRDVDKFLQTNLKLDTGKSSNDNPSYNFLDEYRNLAMWSYKISRYVGEEVLAYLPIPGTVDQGCISVEEATGGMAWSL